jgi:hypothetical protein
MAIFNFQFSIFESSIVASLLPPILQVACPYELGLTREIVASNCRVGLTRKIMAMIRDDYSPGANLYF